jgi:hypothetical protein
MRLQRIGAQTCTADELYMKETKQGGGSAQAQNQHPWRIYRAVREGDHGLGYWTQSSKGCNNIALGARTMVKEAEEVLYK